MKTTMALLVLFAVALTSTWTAPSPAASNRNNNLNSIIDEIEMYNKTLKKEFFVASIGHLTEGTGRCGEQFFCTVQDILEKHIKTYVTKHEHLIYQEKKIVRNLNQFNNETNCVEVLKTVPSTSEQIELPTFMNYLTECIQCRNLNNQTNSC